MSKPRATAPTRRVQGRDVLDLSQYVTYFFTVLANRISSGASRLYLKRFDIGIIEWRLVAMLARKGYPAGVAIRAVKDALAARDAEAAEFADAIDADALADEAEGLSS